MFTVESHEYDPATGIDTFVFAPLGMKAQVKVMEKVEGDPKVFLGVEATYVQQDVTEPEWTVCGNKEIAEIALKYYQERKANA